MLSHHNKHRFRGPIGGTCLSTWPRLLQYLAEITAVLAWDYCSTWAKYWAILFLFCSQSIALLAFHNHIVLKKRQWAWMIQVAQGLLAPSSSTQNIQPPPQLLPAGEGSEYLHFLLENRARRPCSTIVSLANLSRTVASVPRPPAPKIYSPNPNPSPLERMLFTPLSNGEGEAA